MSPPRLLSILAYELLDGVLIKRRFTQTLHSIIVHYVSVNINRKWLHCSRIVIGWQHFNKDRLIKRMDHLIKKNPKH